MIGRKSMLRALQVWCLVIAWCGTSPAVEPQDAPASEVRPQVLYLHTEFLPYQQTSAGDYPYRLGREMIRQSLLLAARDEMGLRTCDETLHETPPDDAEVVHLLLIERANRNGTWHLKLISHQGGEDIHSAEPLWEKSYRFAYRGREMYADMVPKLEADTRDEFIDALERAGLRGAKRTTNNPLPPSEAVEAMLYQVDFIAQFGAVRAAHQATAVHGQTPEWLGVLVRGYANLAMLTQHQWNSAGEVFAARAWLYAQRLVADSKESDWAHWHRAYAWALSGTLQHALADLERIKQRRAENGPAGALPNDPGWTKLIEPYAMCDRAATKRVGEQEQALRGWATRLWFQLASAYRCSQWMYQAAGEVMQACPTAYGVYADLAHHGGDLVATRTGAQAAPIMFGRHAPASLMRVPGLPAELQVVFAISRIQSDFLENVFGDPDLEDAFSAAPIYVARYLREQSKQSADGDLSWSALAFLLEEEQFVQVANYLQVAGKTVEHSLVNVVESVLPLVKDHRYAAYLAVYRDATRRDPEEMKRSFAAMVIQDPRRNMSPMFGRLWRTRDANGRSLGYRAHHDAERNFTMPGMLEYVFTNGPHWNPEDPAFAAVLVGEFSGIAPHSEIAVRMAIQAAVDPAPEKLSTWEAALTEDPVAFTRLGRHYWALGDLPSAKRCLEKSLASLPTFDAAGDLAHLYLQEGDREKWERILLEFLRDSEDLGLEHGMAHQQLASGYAGRGEWAKAKPHGDRAGQTWSDWGLGTASYVCEGLAEWEASERWICQKSVCFPLQHGSDWHFWCRRTGRGDLEASQQWAEKFITRPTRDATRDNLLQQGTFFLLVGKPREALEEFRKASTFRPSFSCTYMVAHLSRELGDEKGREEAIGALEEGLETLRGDPRYDRAVDAAGLAILELLKTGETSTERFAEIERLLRAVDSKVRGTLAYFVGQQLDASGRTAEAETYWRRALVSPDRDPNFGTLAGWELAKRHGTSRPDDDVLDAGHLWPTP